MAAAAAVAQQGHRQWQALWQQVQRKLPQVGVRCLPQYPGYLVLHLLVTQQVQVMLQWVPVMLVLGWQLALPLPVHLPQQSSPEPHLPAVQKQQGRAAVVMMKWVRSAVVMVLQLHL
jgi:hypothetical protein